MVGETITLEPFGNGDVVVFHPLEIDLDLWHGVAQGWQNGPGFHRRFESGLQMGIFLSHFFSKCLQLRDYRIKEIVNDWELQIVKG